MNLDEATAFILKSDAAYRRIPVNFFIASQRAHHWALRGWIHRTLGDDFPLSDEPTIVELARVPNIRQDLYGIAKDFVTKGPAIPKWHDPSWIIFLAEYLEKLEAL